jgi:hypothetical protein
MRTGTAYFGHHDPRHLATDLQEMARLGLDDVLLAAQENDFIHFPGKLKHTAHIANDLGLRPIAIFWGALNLFGGGRSSHYLLEHREATQVSRDGTPLAAGCYVNPGCVNLIQEMIDTIAGLGYQGYFVDEPLPLGDCFCASCREAFERRHGGDLAKADPALQETFRSECVIDYVRTIADYCKAKHPALEVLCCLTPWNQSLWEPAAGIASLDNLGTDLYWVNEERDVEKMTPLVGNMRGICAAQGKRHHEWLQCWLAFRGYEERILQQGKILVRERPDAVYIWGWRGQAGTAEACEDPELAWAKACEVIALARSAG